MSLFFAVAATADTEGTAPPAVEAVTLYSEDTGTPMFSEDTSTPMYSEDN